MAIVLVSPSVLQGGALYNSLIQAIYDMTGRPDLINETALALRKATMKLHLADFWKHDETTVYPTVAVSPGDAYSYRYALVLSSPSAFPLLRKVAAIKEYNAVPLGYELQFEELDISNLLDDYRTEKTNYWTQAGQQATIRSSKELTQVAVTYFKYPDVSGLTFTSWIASQFPDAILEEAMAYIFRSIGKVEESREYSNRFPENLAMIRMAQVS